MLDVRASVRIGLVGKADTLKKRTSHAVTRILWHVLPAGQQTAVVFAAKARQVLVERQQKLLGSPCPQAV